MKKYFKTAKDALFVALCTGLFLLVSQFAAGQSHNDSIVRRNVVKIDLTNQLWYEDPFCISYERVVKKNQTFGISFGTHNLFGVAENLDNDAINIERTNASGFKFAGEYRFYLGKENKYTAPHGVYIGPYFAYHTFSNDWKLTYNGASGPQEGTLDATIGVTNVGFQAGYQFLINNRWSIDMTFIGGSISNYKAKMNLEGTFDIDESEINQDVLDALLEKFPMLEDLINEKTIEKDGKIDSWAAGYRYQLQVGYAFGGGKKHKTPKKGSL